MAKHNELGPVLITLAAGGAGLWAYVNRGTLFSPAAASPPLLSPPPVITPPADTTTPPAVTTNGPPPPSSALGIALGNDVVSAISGLYQKYYNRAADSSGLQYWVGQVQIDVNAGEPYDAIALAIEQAFATSAEEQQLVAANTPAPAPAPVAPASTSVTIQAPDGTPIVTSNFSNDVNPQTGMEPQTAAVTNTPVPTSPPLLSPPVALTPVVEPPSPAPAPAPAPAQPVPLSPPVQLATTPHNVSMSDLAQWDISAFTGAAKPFAQYAAQILTNLYFQNLHRTPDVAGMNYWLTHMANNINAGSAAGLSINDAVLAATSDIEADFAQPGLQGWR